MKLKHLVPLEDILLIMKLLPFIIINFFVSIFCLLNYIVSLRDGSLFHIFVAMAFDTQLALQVIVFNDYEECLAIVLWALLQYFFHS